MTNEESSPTPLVTTEDVRRWVAERDAAAQEYGEVLRKLSVIQQKLDALAQLLPQDVISRLIGAPPIDLPAKSPSGKSEPRAAETGALKDVTPKQVPITDAAVSLLSGESGGRTPAWLRHRMLEDAHLAPRVKRTPTSVSNALLRLVSRGLIVKEDKLYYHPDTYKAIKQGDIEEERLENTASLSFNGVMHKVMSARGGEFTAADAIEVAKGDEFLREKLEEQPSRVYSWLSREVFKNRLLKAGEYYSYPADKEAPDGGPSSASFAREAATSLFDSQRT